MQVSLNPNDIAPQLPHVLILDLFLYELKPINTKTNNKRGIKNKKNQLDKKPSESTIEVEAEEIK